MLPTGDTIQILAVAVAWAELCLYFSLLAPHLILWLLRTIKLMAAAAAPGEGWREPSKGEGTWVRNLPPLAPSMAAASRPETEMWILFLSLKFDNLGVEGELQNSLPAENLFRSTQSPQRSWCLSSQCHRTWSGCNNQSAEARAETLHLFLKAIIVSTETQVKDTCVMWLFISGPDKMYEFPLNQCVLRHWVKCLKTFVIPEPSGLGR